MDLDKLPAEVWRNAQEILGYLNFSSGNSDPRFLGKPQSSLRTDRGSAVPAATSQAVPGAGTPVGECLAVCSKWPSNGSNMTPTPFATPIKLAPSCVWSLTMALPAYREHHRDLLFHQTEVSLFQPFFIGRMFEVVLRQGPPLDESDRIVHGAIARLNDFIGHRPVAVLRSEQKPPTLCP